MAATPARLHSFTACGLHTLTDRSPPPVHLLGLLVGALPSMLSMAPDAPDSTGPTENPVGEEDDVWEDPSDRQAREVVSRHEPTTWPIHEHHA